MSWLHTIRGCCLLLVGFAFAVGTQAQGPSMSLPGGTLYRAGPDYATDVLQDAWDFSNPEDITQDPEQISGFGYPSLSTIASIGPGAAFLSGGWFRGIASGDTAFHLLYWADLNTLNPGRSGERFPIETSRFRKIALKLRISGASQPNAVVAHWYHVSRAETPDWASRLGGVIVGSIPAGNSERIYVLDLAQTTPQPGSHPFASHPLVKSFRLDHVRSAGSTVEVDWVRLTASNGGAGAAMMPVALGGCSQFQYFTITDAANVPVTIGDSTGNNVSRTLNYGILPPGAYNISATCANGQTAPRGFQVNTPPTVTVVDPDETGDPATDYALTARHDPWDFEQPTDLARSLEANNLSITQGACASGGCGLVPTARPGATGSMLRASPWGNIADPNVALLDTALVPLNTRRHRLLTLSLRNNRPYVLNAEIGAVARVFWSSAAIGNGTTLTTSQDMRVWPGFERYTIDLASLRTDNGGIETECAPTCPTTPWEARAIRHFRIDPHEYGDVPTSFDIDDVTLTGPDWVRLGQTFAVRYAIADADTIGSTYEARIYRSGWPDRSGRTLLATIPGLTPGTHSYPFNPQASGTPPGDYTISVEVDETRSGFVQTSVAHSSGPLVVEQVYGGPATVTVASPSPNQNIDVPFTIQGCAYDSRKATGAINIDDLAVNMRAVAGPRAGTVLPLGFPGFSGLGTLQFGPYGAGVVCPGAPSPYDTAGFRVNDVGLGSGNTMHGSWVIEVYARSTITGDMDRLAEIPVQIGPVPPPAPVNFQASAAGNTVTVSWQAPGPGVASYQVQGATNPTFQPIAFQVNVPVAGTHQGPLPSGRYYLRVFSRATNGAWSDASPVRQVDVGLPTPPAPPALAVTQAAANPITLGWSPGSGGAPASYVLHAGTAPGASNLAVAPMGLATTIAATAPVGVTIYARVVASNAAGQATSNEVSFALTPPLPPTLAPATVGNGHVTLRWSPGAGTPPSGYTILARYPGSPAVIASLGATGTSITVPAPPGTYRVSVVASNGVGTSAESGPITVVVP